MSYYRALGAYITHMRIIASSMVCFEADPPMPDKPFWCGRLEEIAKELGALPEPWVDRPILEQALGIGRRGARRFWPPCFPGQIAKGVFPGITPILGNLRRRPAGEQALFDRGPSTV